MKIWAGLWVAVCAVGLQAQQPQLERRTDGPAKLGALPPSPAAMKVPAKLEPAKAANAKVLVNYNFDLLAD